MKLNTASKKQKMYVTFFFFLIQLLKNIFPSYNYNLLFFKIC